jgi:hypothetical protein
MGEDLIPFEMPGGSGVLDGMTAPLGYVLGTRRHGQDYGRDRSGFWDGLFNDPHGLLYSQLGMGLDRNNTIGLKWTPGSRLAQECRRFTPGQSGSHSEAMAVRLEQIADNLRHGQPIAEAKEAVLWLVAGQTERRREGPSTVDAQAHEVVDVQMLGPA